MGNLSSSELIRYSRHLLLPEVGNAGQEKLKAAHVLVCGAGGLGAPVLLYLAAAGVGHVGVADFDVVDRSNLQRQVIFDDSQVGLPKAECAIDRMRKLNPEIGVTKHDLQVGQDNVSALVKQYDIVVDGTDNFSTRYLLNDAAALNSKPYVYGSIFRFDGQVSVFNPPGGPCYRCLFPDPPAPDAVPNCAEGGVLGVLAGTVGSLQATECIKLILSCGETLSGRLLLYDALSMSFDVLKIERNRQCALCGENPTIVSPVEQTVACSTAPLQSGDLSPVEFERQWQTASDAILIDVRNPGEYQVGHLDRAVNLPVGELELHLAGLSKDRTTFVYCRAGLRGRKAAELLAANGFRNVFNLAGGLIAHAQERSLVTPQF